MRSAASRSMAAADPASGLWALARAMASDIESGGCADAGRATSRMVPQPTAARARFNDARAIDVSVMMAPLQSCVACGIRPDVLRVRRRNQHGDSAAIVGVLGMRVHQISFFELNGHEDV